jgi:hypothetical protein
MKITVCTLVLVAVAIMASGGSSAPVLPGLGCAGGLTRFVCVKCTETCRLSSCCLFLNLASVRRHIAASKSCKDARLGFRAIQVQARAGDVIARGGGAAGPAPTIRHQAPGAQTRRFTVTIYIYMDSFIAFTPAFRSEPHSEGVDYANSMQKIASSRHVCTFFKSVWNGLYLYVLVYTLNYKIIVKYIVVHTRMF